MQLKMRNTIHNLKIDEMHKLVEHPQKGKTKKIMYKQKTEYAMKDTCTNWEPQREKSALQKSRHCQPQTTQRRSNLKPS